MSILTFRIVWDENGQNPDRVGLRRSKEEQDEEARVWGGGWRRTRSKEEEVREGAQRWRSEEMVQEDGGGSACCHVEYICYESRESGSIFWSIIVQTRLIIRSTGYKILKSRSRSRSHYSYWIGFFPQPLSMFGVSLVNVDQIAQKLWCGQGLSSKVIIINFVLSRTIK